MLVLGLDPSLSNWGWVLADVVGTQITPVNSGVICIPPVKVAKTKAVNDMLRVSSLYSEVLKLTSLSRIACIEFPTGGRDSSAAFSYATCIALIAALKANGVTIYPVTPQANKKTVGKLDASKEDVMDWIESRHTNFLPRKKDNTILKGKAEHIADALLTIHTGLPQMKLTATLASTEVLAAIAAVFSANGYNVQPDDITIDENWEATVNVDTDALPVQVEADKPKRKAAVAKKPEPQPEAQAAPAEEPNTAESTDADEPPFDTGEPEAETAPEVEAPATTPKKRVSVFARNKE